MSASQNSKSASGNADNGGSVVDRMGTIIRNAHRAIEVLKEENSALKIANDKLQVMVDDLLLQLQSRPAPSQRSSLPVKNSISLLGLSNPYQPSPAAVPSLAPASSLSKGLMPKSDQALHASISTPAMMTITDGITSNELLKPSAASSISSIQKIGNNDSRVISASLKLEIGNSIIMPPVGTATGQQKKAVQSKPGKESSGSHAISPKKAAPVVATASAMKRMISTASDNVTLSLSSVRPVVAATAALAVGKELGQAKYKALLSSGDVSIYLSGVTVDNVHSAAKKMRAISPDDMMRGLLGVIAIHLRGDLLHEWRRLPLITSSLVPSEGMQEGSSSSSVTNVQLIPLTMIERLDALVSLLVSLTTRTGWGVDALSRLIDGLSNHILCSIRNQLSSSPFYAAVMGTCSGCEDRIDKISIYPGEDRYDNSGHDVIVPGDAPNAPTDDVMVQESSSEEDNDSVGTHLSYSSVDDDSVANDQGEANFVRSDDDGDDDDVNDDDDDDDDDDDSEGDNDDSKNDVAAAPEHELASDVPSVRRSELAALLDLGSSDDSEDDASEPPTAAAASACPHRGISSRPPSDDDRGSPSQAIDPNLSSTHNTAIAADAPPSTCSTPLLLLQSSCSSQLDRQWIKAFSTASTLYIVLSLLLRLSRPRQVAMLLRQLTLLTSGNCSYGAMMGVVAVLGSSRFSSSSSSVASADSTMKNNDEVRAALFQLLINCYVDLIDRNSRDESSLEDRSEHNLSFIVGLLLKSKHMFKVTGIAELLMGQQSKGITMSAGAAAAAMLERVLRHRITPLSCMDHHEEVLYLSLETYRRVGFWAAIEKLSLVSIPLGDDTADGCIFTMLGLSYVTAFTSTFRQLLLNWTNEESALRGRGTSHNSLKSFLSEPYGSMSDRQLNVHSKCIALEVPVNSIRTEEMLMDEFSVHWKETLASLSTGPIDRHINFIAHLTRGIAVVNDILQSILSTEYSTTDFGWCSGAQGLGSRLELKANDKTAHIQLQLRSLLSSSNSISSINRQSSSRSAAIPPTIVCYPYSSISPLKTIESVELLDYCWSEVFQCSSSSGGGVGAMHDTVGRAASSMSIEEVNKEDMLSKLHKSCTELLFVIALSFVEHFLYLFLSSLRGLLRTLRPHVSSLLTIPNADDGIKHRLIEGYLLLIDEICSVIADIPLPWSGICNVRIQHDIFHAATSIMEVVQAATDQTGYTLSRSFTHFPHGQWLMDLRAQLPAYVINLDRRVDRWRHSLFKHSKEGFSLIRVSAVDGAAVVHRAVHHDSSGRRRIDDDDNDDATVNLIPECDVSRTWDSTLNSQFDSNCPSNHCVVSTVSERACAASHLHVWRMISGIITTTNKHKHKLMHQQLSDKGAIRDDLHDLTKWLSSLRRMLPDYDYSYIVENMLMLNNNKPDKKNASKAKSTSTGQSSSISSINNNNNKQSSSRKESEPGSEYYLIMEDDLAASPEYSGKLQSLIHRLMKKLPVDVDILYLKGIIPKSSQHLKASVLNKLFMEVNYVWTLKAYVLRESAVDTLLANLPITGPVGNFVAQLIYSRQLKACIFRNHIFSKKTKFTSDMRHSGTVRSVSSVRGIVTDRSKRFEKMKSSNSGGGSSKGKKRKRSITFAPDVK